MSFTRRLTRTRYLLGKPVKFSAFRTCGMPLSIVLILNTPDHFPSISGHNKSLETTVILIKARIGRFNWVALCLMEAIQWYTAWSDCHRVVSSLISTGVSN